MSPGSGSRIMPSASIKSSNSIASRMRGTVARPHCFTEETAIRSHRSRRRPRASDARVTSVRAVMIG
jgi:hypothetical protein